MSELMSIKEASEWEIFKINVDDLQYEAKEYLGRELNYEEVLEIKDKLHDAISDSLIFIYPNIFNDFN